MAPRLGGIKQKKLFIHPSTSMWFLLCYSPKPRSHVRILIYRKWSIAQLLFPDVLCSAVTNRSRREKLTRTVNSTTKAWWKRLYQWMNGYHTSSERVQITRETSTNIRYLYSSHSSRPREVQNRISGRNRWIVNLLLQVLVCSIAVYF